MWACFGMCSRDTDRFVDGVNSFLRFAVIMFAFLGGVMMYLVIDFSGDGDTMVEALGLVVGMLYGCVTGMWSIVPEIPDEEEDKEQSFSARFKARRRFYVLGLVTWVAGMVFGLGLMEEIVVLMAIGPVLFIGLVYWTETRLNLTVTHPELLLPSTV